VPRRPLRRLRLVHEAGKSRRDVARCDAFTQRRVAALLTWPTRVASAQTSLLPVVAGKPKHDSSFKGGKYAEGQTRRD
jgi:hypothetical protein